MLQNIIVRGHVKIYKITDDAELLISDKKNTITNAGFETFSRLIAQVTGATPTEDAIHSLWVEASATALPAAAVTDTGPQGAVVKYYTFDRSADVTANAGGTSGLSQFVGTVEKAEANGQIIRAVGLYTRDDNADPTLATAPQLVARQVIGSIEKTADFALRFEWTIQFSTV